MTKPNDLDMIKRLIGAGEHVPPAIEVLKSELRTDSGVDPPVDPPPGPTVYIIIKWKYYVRVAQLDKFHTFLAKHEGELIADTQGLKIGASYYGTYAELPRTTTHQTLWWYESVAAIDRFKSALSGKKKSSELRKNLKELLSYIDEPSLTMHRLVRASALAGAVARQRRADPVMDILAGS